MTGARDDGLWISNHPGGGSGGQTAEGAAAAGGIGAAAAGIKKLLFGGPKSEAQQQEEAQVRQENEEKWQNHMAARQAEAEECKANAQRNRQINQFNHYAKVINTGGLPQEIRREAQGHGTLSRLVFDRASAHRNALRNRRYHNEAQRARAEDMLRHTTIRLSDFRWKNPSGDLFDHGVVRPSKLDLGYGGDYTFNRVWSFSVPLSRRSAISHYHRRVADIYAITADEAALSVISEFSNPGCAEGLSQFRAPSWTPKVDTSSPSDSPVVDIQEYSIINIMHAQLEYMRINSLHYNAECSEPRHVLDLVSLDIKRRQNSRLEKLSYLVYNQTQVALMTKAQDILDGAMVRTSRNTGDLNFTNEQYVKISDACSREDTAMLAACARSIRGEGEEVIEDMLAGAGGTRASGGRTARSYAGVIIVGGHRMARLVRKSPVCRDAIDAYWNRRCMDRVLPEGRVRVDSQPEGQVYGPVEEAE